MPKIYPVKAGVGMLRPELHSRGPTPRALKAVETPITENNQTPAENDFYLRLQQLNITDSFITSPVSRLSLCIPCRSPLARGLQTVDIKSK